MKNNFDIIYIVFAAVILITDVMTKNVMVEAIAFLSASIGFFATVMNIAKFKDDERIKIIGQQAAYIAFMLTIIGLMLTMTSIRYFGIRIEVYEFIRYLATMMYLLFIGCFAVIKRYV